MAALGQRKPRYENNILLHHPGQRFVPGCGGWNQRSGQKAIYTEEIAAVPRISPEQVLLFCCIRCCCQTSNVYISFHSRFTRNNFADEKNHTIVTFPIKNLEMRDYLHSHGEHDPVMDVDRGVASFPQSINGDDYACGHSRHAVTVNVRVFDPSTEGFC
jgi:hypothetical protein